MIAGLALAVVCSAALQIVLVAAVAAMRPRGNIYAVIIGVAIVTSPVVFVADHLLFGRQLTVDGRLFFVLLHLGIGAMFFHFITLPDRSVTLRILVELRLAPGGTLSVEALNRRYSVRTMIESRLEQLAHGEFLAIEPDGALTLKPRGIWFGRFVTGGRRLFRISSAN